MKTQFCSSLSGFACALVVLAGILSPVAPIACSPAQQAKEVSGGIHLALCVYQHEDETPAAIVAACAGSTLEDVTAILTAQRASRARYAAAGCPATDAGAARAPNYGPGK
jgi:hypothetical protein